MGNVTIKDVANETGLSIATVSYAINGKKNLPPETVQKVQEAIKRLGYIKNYSASSLVSNTSHLIGVVIPQTEPGSAMVFENPFYSQILSSIEYHARLRGYHVIVSGTNADEKYFNLASQRNLDGVIVIGAYSEDFFNGLPSESIPVVLVDSYLQKDGYSQVKLDDVQGGYLATSYLLEHGHEKIGFLSGRRKEGGVSLNRYNGYEKAMNEAGKKIVNEWVMTCNVGFEAARKITRKIMGGLDITAVFCTADIMAVGVIRELNSMGIRVPEDISVMGFDNLNIANYCTPSLTTVGQDIFEKGKQAVEMLYKHLAEEEEKGIRKLSGGECILPLEIIERESVCRINA